MSDLIVRSMALGMASANCYFVYYEGNKECIIVDAPGETERIVKALESLGLKPVAVLLTHSHFDHIGAAEALKAKYNIPVCCHKAEEEMLNDMGTVTSLHAEVVDMACGVTSIGYQNFKQPRAEKYFIITFKDDNGESLQISVDEELYGGFEIGMKGNLTLIDGQLSSFELDGN